MKALVIFYSRSGNTRRVAGLIATALEARGAEVVSEELVDKRSREGFGGLLSAGFDATLGRATAIHAPRADVSAFDVVVIGTPIWAWAGTPAVRAFCRTWGRKAKRSALFCTLMNSTPGGTFKTLSSELQDEPLATMAISHADLKGGPALEAKIDEFAGKLAT